MNEAKKKLIIHETDCHGCGRFYYNGKTYNYAYDDETGDVKSAVESLIEIGFINPDDVVIIDEDNIYPLVEKLYVTNETKEAEGKRIFSYSIGRTCIVESENWEDIEKAFKEHNKEEEEE